MNNISFQGHTTLILSPKTYDKANEITTRLGRHLSETNKTHLSNGKVYTSEANSSKFAVILRNEKDGIIKHVPTNEQSDDVLSEIVNAVDKLKKAAKGKLTAWIIGGDNIEGRNGDRSIKTLGKIADELCDRPDIDTSILAGSKSGDDRIFFHTLSGELELGLAKDPKATTAKLSPEENLENFFDIVELNNVDLKA